MADTRSSPPPEGVYVPVPTFFRPATSTSSASPLQAELDLDTQVRHSVFLAKNGIRGIVHLGSIGEAIHLSAAERTALVSEVRRGLEAAGFQDYHLLAGVLTTGVQETHEWLADYA